MERLAFTSKVDAPAGRVFEWHTRAAAFQRLVPPWMQVKLDEFEGVEEQARVAFRIGLGPLFLRWRAVHTEVEADRRRFVDIQEKGPFRHWRHVHKMDDAGAESCKLTDEIEYEVPLGGIGRTLGGRTIRSKIEQQFAYRHRVTRADLRQIGEATPGLTIAISGASGLVGTALTNFLEAAGYTVLRMVRSKPAGEKEIYWNYRDEEIEAEKLEGIDGVVHLAAESPFAPRWTETKKARIYASRVRGTQFISETLAKLSDPPSVFVPASAMAIYGSRGDEVITEADAPGQSGFLTAVVQDWEKATLEAQEAGIRTVPLRFGIILSPAGGALQFMRLPFLLGLGGTAGNKGIWMSWIALDDAVYAIHQALRREDLHGPLNVATSNPLHMEDFTSTLARVLNRPSALHVPTPVIRSAAGEVADEFVLTSLRLEPEKLNRSGFQFEYPHLEGALRHVLGRAVDIPYAEHFDDQPAPA